MECRKLNKGDRENKTRSLGRKGPKTLKDIKRTPCSFILYSDIGPLKPKVLKSNTIHKTHPFSNFAPVQQILKIPY